MNEYEQLKQVESTKIQAEQSYSANHVELDVSMDGIFSEVARIVLIDMNNNRSSLYEMKKW